MVDKGVRIEEYKYAKFDVYAGSFMTVFIAFFIILPRAPSSTPPASWWIPRKLRRAPWNRWQETSRHTFAVGLLNASFLAAFVLPLATAYGLSEAFGWESGINKTFKEAPQFLGPTPPSS